MISIRRYMEGRRDNYVSGAAAFDPAVLVGLCKNLIRHIGAYTISNEAGAFKAQLDALASAISPAPAAEESARIEESVRVLLSAHSRSVREASQNTALEMQRIVGALGEALIVLSSGTERSVSRLQKIQETLQRSSLINDVAGLRASLSEAVQLIKDESSEEWRTAARERESFETQVVGIRERMIGNPNRRLPGRAEGVRTISDSFATPVPGKSLFVLAFVFDQLKAMVQRYGPEAVDDLFLQVVRERVQPLAPANTAYRWTVSSLVVVFRAEFDLARLQFEMAEANRIPLVCRIALGSRTAVLKVRVSHLAAQMDNAETGALINEIDRFTGFEDREAA